MPAPDEDVLLVHSADGQLGPLSRRTLKSHVDEGRVAVTDHVWMKGMAEWLPIADQAGLLDDLDAAPAEEARLPGESDDDHQDRIFTDLVKKSWDYLEDHEFAGHIDEVFLGAVITGTLDTGYSLIDLNSNGSHHFLRFQNLDDGSRIIVRCTHLTGTLAVAKVLGQRASVVIGYGEKVGSIGKVMNAVRAEMKSNFLQNPDPGTITVDGDMASGYVYCQVDMYWSIDEYVASDYRIDTAKLSAHIGATTHALRKYLRGRFA
jgi:hypothetical protein